MTGSFDTFSPQVRCPGEIRVYGFNIQTRKPFAIRPKCGLLSCDDCLAEAIRKAVPDLYRHHKLVLFRRDNNRSEQQRLTYRLKKHDTGAFTVTTENHRFTLSLPVIEPNATPYHTGKIIPALTDAAIQHGAKRLTFSGTWKKPKKDITYLTRRTNKSKRKVYTAIRELGFEAGIPDSMSIEAAIEKIDTLLESWY